MAHELLADDALVRPTDSLWRNRNFMLLWFAEGAGMLGPQLALVALPLLALKTLQASTFEVSLLTFLGWLPYMIFSLPAGVIADRLDQRKIMIFCDLGRMALMLTVPIAGFAGFLSLAYLYAVVGVSGTLTVLFGIAYRSQLPKLVSSSQLVDANGKLMVSESFAELIGPSLGGALVGLVGAGRTLFANVVTLGLSALTLGSIRIPEAERRIRTATERTTFKAATGEGLSYIRTRPILRSLLLATSMSNFFVMGVTSIDVTYMVRNLHAATTVVGMVFTVAAVGGLVAGLLSKRVIARVGSARIIWASLLVPGPLYLLMPVAVPGWGVGLYALGLATFYAAITLFNVGASSYRQAVVPSDLLSRVNAGYLWICYGVIPLGALFGGTLGTVFGLRATLWVCAFGMWSASLSVYFSPLRRLRDVPLPKEPAAEPAG